MSNSSFFVDSNAGLTAAENRNPALTVGISYNTSTQAIPIPILWEA